MRARRRTGRPSLKEAADISDRILSAAEDAFCEHGMAFSMDDIALRAGVTKKAIYSRYTSKRTLLLAVVHRNTEAFHEFGSREKTAKNPLSALRSSSWELFRRASERKAIAFGIFLDAESMRHPDLLSAIRGPASRAVGPMRDIMTRLWREGYAEKQPSPTLGEAVVDVIMQGAKRAWQAGLVKEAQRRRAFVKQWPIILTLLRVTRPA